jgi:hypothetical protein
MTAKYFSTLLGLLGFNLWGITWLFHWPHFCTPALQKRQFLPWWGQAPGQGLSVEFKVMKAEI